MAALREAILYQYTFFALALESPDGSLAVPAAHEVEAPLNQAIQAQADWLGLPLTGHAPIVFHPDRERRRLRRLYPPEGQSSLFRKNPPWAARARCYEHNDAVALYTAFAREGAADLTTWPRLHQAEWQPPAENRFFLGQTTCFGGRVADLAAAHCQAEAVLPPPGADPALELRCVELPGGLWLFDRFSLPDRLTLFYPDTDEAEHLADAYFREVLPRLALYLHKIAHHASRLYDRRLRGQLQTNERRLSEVLARTRTPRQELTGLERQLRELADAYNTFTGDLAAFLKVQQVVRVNLLNLHETCTQHALPRVGPLAARLAVAEKALQQLEADQGFYEAIERQASVALAALQAQADIERSKEEKEENRLAEKRNLLLAFLALILGLGEVFSDETAAALVRSIAPGLAVAVEGQRPFVPEGWVFAARFSVLALTGLVVFVLGWSLWKWYQSRKDRRAAAESGHRT